MKEESGLLSKLDNTFVNTKKQVNEVMGKMDALKAKLEG